MISPWGLILTVLLYKIAEKFRSVPFLKNIPPMLISGIVVIILLNLFHLDYSEYNQSAKFLTFMLIPATIALGYPLYKNINILTKNKRIIYSAFFAASLCAVFSTFLIAKICHTETNIIISMLPKSVTAPIALEISKNIGGVPEITICMVVLTGIFGAVTGHKILEFLKIKNDIAIGLAIGAASHVVGTSKCIEKGKEKQVVMSTLALVVVGIITTLILPVIIRILFKI